jgi:hypothetical protein
MVVVPDSEICMVEGTRRIETSHRSVVTVHDAPTIGGRRPSSGRLEAVQSLARRATARAHLVVVGDAPADEAEYRVSDLLARGGMGEVLAARQVSLDRDIVIKRLVNDAADPEARIRFLAEAVVTANLDHPNIVPIHDLGIDQRGRPFYAMKRIRGRSWGSCWRSMTLEENLDVLMRISDAIAFAHAHGIVHRDLKPDNVMLGDFGEVLVVDWGLAACLSDLVPVEGRRRVACGTPAYMAPEMAQGDNAAIGPASDVYLLGAVLHELLTGLPPHPGTETAEAIRAAAENRIDPAAPAGLLGDVARRAMHTDPQQRFSDVKAFQVALREYRGHAQGLVLLEIADATLVQARAHPAYQSFARAMNAYEEVEVLWPGNERAHTGARLARQAFAERALEVDDLDLAQDLLAGRGYADLDARLAACRRVRAAAQRRSRMLVIAVAVLAAVSVTTLVALIVALRFNG